MSIDQQNTSSSIVFGEGLPDEQLEIASDKKMFLTYQKQIEGLNVQLKELKKQQKTHKDAIFKFLDENNISSVFVEDYIFSHSTKDSFTCSRELFEEKFPDVDAAEFCKTKTSNTVKLRQC